ncbi:hypothetical protein M3Y99_01528300 [Aphelenchoides fujianensis]|nr:hypothetical protein M3Y99_01528300 [Aphelenchoides fujianensis]
MCRDEDFGPLLCRPECLPAKLYVSRDCDARDIYEELYYYNRSESTTRNETNTTWTAEKLPFWKAEGGVLIDRVAFHDNFTVGGDDSPHVFAVENARLMVGRIVSYYRPNYHIAGYFGLAPGKYNLVVQAYDQGFIPAPVLAYYGDGPLYFGGLPRDAPCADWAHFPTFQNKWQVHFTYEWDEDEDNSVYFSDEIIERALKAGVLVRESNEKDVYRANCSTHLAALMAFGDQQFEFTLPSLREGGSCELTIGRFRFFGEIFLCCL